VNVFATVLAAFATCLCGYYFVAGLRSGQVEVFSKFSVGAFARQSRPGWYWATIVTWLICTLAAGYYSVTWALALAAA
jgi:hypothetical protein